MELKSQKTKITRFAIKKDFSFGENLKKIRVKKNLTTKEVADIFGLQSQQILRYELDEQELSTEKLRKLSEFLDVSPLELLGIEKVNARLNPQSGVVYDWEIRKAGVYWVCPICKVINVSYGDEHIEQLKDKTLACECENDNCGEYFDKFWKVNE